MESERGEKNPNRTPRVLRWAEGEIFCLFYMTLEKPKIIALAQLKLDIQNKMTVQGRQSS